MMLFCLVTTGVVTLSAAAAAKGVEPLDSAAMHIQQSSSACSADFDSESGAWSRSACPGLVTRGAVAEETRNRSRT
jgi:hypothetical protein